MNFAIPPKVTPKVDIIAELERGLTKVRDMLTADKIGLEVKYLGR